MTAGRTAIAPTAEPMPHTPVLRHHAGSRAQRVHATAILVLPMLAPGGGLSLQTITCENADRRDFSRFFAEQVFPESDLPHFAEIVAAAQGLFEIEELRQDRAHYARTARAWLSRLKARSAVAEALVGAETVERYKRYLGLLVLGFHAGTMSLARIGMRRLEKRR